MSNLDPLPPIDNPPITDGPGFLARSKKAIAGGAAGAVTGALASLKTALTDGQIDTADLWTIAGSAVAGFVVAFATVWLAPANATP